MNQPETLVLASSNKGKIAEFNHLLAALNRQVVPQAQYQVVDAEETGLTFVENALLKARHAAQQTGLVALADDSGLVVHALQGQPGIYSARYAGQPTDDNANNAKLLQAMQDIPAGQRQAHFHCSIVLVRHALDPEPIIAEANWYGEILFAPQGEQGFGYDPLFYIPQLGCSAAQLSKEQKNTQSHRALAMQQLQRRLVEGW